MTARGMKSGKRPAIKSASSSSKRTNILAAVAFVLVAVVLATNVFPSLFSKPDRTIPDGLVGVWTTTTEAYADRAFEISKTTVLFRTGPAENEFNFHEIKEVRHEDADDGATLYTIVYTDDLEFLFTYQPVNDVIRFANQPEMFWNRQDATPTTIAALPTLPADSEDSAQAEPSGEMVETAPATEPDEEPVAGQTEQLIREVFSFRGSGRDPFTSLLESGEVRPLAQDLRVTSITFDPRYPSASVAVLRDTTVGQRYSVRMGDELGRMRVAEIAPLQVVLILSEFGSERQVVLRQVRRKPRTTGGH